MPLYEYICSKCKETFTVLQKVGSSEQDTTCPRCGSREVKKLVSSFACGIGSFSSSGGSTGFSGGT